MRFTIYDGDFSFNFFTKPLKVRDDAYYNRFKQLALAVIRFTKNFPNEQEYWRIKGQIIRCSTSAAANYRASGRAKSNAFINKHKIVEEETDETMFWLEFTVGVSYEWRPDEAPLYREANELLSIIVSSVKSARKKDRGKGKVPDEIS